MHGRAITLNFMYINIPILPAGKTFACKSYSALLQGWMKYSTKIDNLHLYERLKRKTVCTENVLETKITNTMVVGNEEIS